MRRVEMMRLSVALALVSFLAVCGTATGAYLIVGEDTEVGWIEASAYLETLTITIAADEGWILEETYIYVDTRPPRSCPRRFTRKHEELGGVRMDTHTIGLDDFDVGCDDVLYVAVCAVVTSTIGEHRTEIAWGKGGSIRAVRDWATYFSTEVICETP